jgi:hypothetical protein
MRLAGGPEAGCEDVLFDWHTNPLKNGLIKLTERTVSTMGMCGDHLT